MKKVKVCLHIEPGSILQQLGWTDNDLLETKRTMIGCRLANNLPLTPAQVIEYSYLQARK